MFVRSIILCPFLFPITQRVTADVFGNEAGGLACRAKDVMLMTRRTIRALCFVLVSDHAMMSITSTEWEALDSTVTLRMQALCAEGLTLLSKLALIVMKEHTTEHGVNTSCPFLMNLTSMPRTLTSDPPVPQCQINGPECKRDGKDVIPPDTQEESSEKMCLMFRNRTTEAVRTCCVSEAVALLGGEQR